MLTDADRVPLAARAWIGDGATGASVAADGTVDWYCPGRLDSAPLFGRLLDRRGGALRIGPIRDTPSARRRRPAASQYYRDGSMVAVTELAGAGGRLRLVDLLPWAGASSTPAGRLVRLATALAGPIDVEVEVYPPTGPGAPEVSSWSEGLAIGQFRVRCGFPLEPAPLGRDEPRWRGVRRLEPGQSLVVSVDDARRRSLHPLSPEGAARLAAETDEAWRSWLTPFAYRGPHPRAAARAALALRCLSGPAGAPAAAGTTSLPRRAAGERTSDGRVCRLRDAAAAAEVLALVGLSEDAEAAERWLRTTLDGTAPPWSALRDLDGGPAPLREELGLGGWRSGQPVVSGVEPVPIDLDGHAAVLTAVSASQRGPWGTGGDGPLTAILPALAEGADWVADHWQEPDGGAWACRGPAAHLVASTVEAWVALDSCARRASAANPLDLAAATWHAEARRVVSWLEAHAVGPSGALVRDDSGLERADAALLRVAWRGPWPRPHPLVAATVELILERLGSGGLLHRLGDDVDDGLPGADSPDLVASLWAVKALARLGRWEEAHERMEVVVGLPGDVGLLSDTAEPASGEMFGNFPSTPAHLALLDAGLALGAGPA